MSWITGIDDWYKQRSPTGSFETDAPRLEAMSGWYEDRARVNELLDQERAEWWQRRLAHPSGFENRKFANVATHVYTGKPQDATTALANLGALGNPWGEGGYRQPTANISPWLSGAGMY